MMWGFRNAYDYDSVEAFSEIVTKISRRWILVLLIHEHDDQIVTIVVSAQANIKLLPNGRMMVYPGRRHTLLYLIPEEINKDR